jgi:hypothetical protein
MELLPVCEQVLGVEHGGTLSIRHELASGTARVEKPSSERSPS